MITTSTRKPPMIISHFAKDLSHIIAEYLINPDLDDKRIPLKDRLAIKLILTLNKPFYQRELLFRDYQQQLIDYPLFNGEIKKLNPESLFYTQTVLGNRLTIVSKHKSLPNNLHLLLMMLFRYSLDDNWQRTRIKRRKKSPQINDLFFKKTAKNLQRQCSQLKSFNKLAENNRDKYGILYLMVGTNSTELVEEISIFDIITCLPTSLKIELESLPVWYVPLIERIISSLNASYGLLRSCGLSPQEWDGRLSIPKCRDLKKLKKQADEYLKTGEKKDRYSAYQQAFSDLQAQGKNKIAGFETLLDFVNSDVGIALLKIEFADLTGNEEVAMSDYTNTEMQEGLKHLLVDYAASFTPVTAYFFEQVYILSRPLHNQEGVLNDTELQRLLANDESYLGLDDEKLAALLAKKTQAIIKKHLDLNAFSTTN